jgi:hypothetical protein
MALAPILEFVLLSEDYIKCENKKIIKVRDLNKLSNSNIVKLLRNKCIIETNKSESNIDLFPLEVVCGQ